MRSSENLRRLALVFLAAPLLASCQTTSKASSSTIERVGAETDEAVTERMCAALRPEKVSREDYDAAPDGVKTALSRGAAAWSAVCQK